MNEALNAEDGHEPLVFRRDTGFQQHLGYTAYVYMDRCEVELKIEPQFLNRRDLLHGGVYATLLDAALGYACSRRHSDDASAGVVTISLTTNYLASVAEGTVRATGRVTGGGRKTMFAEGAVEAEDGTVLATASGVFKRVTR